MKTKNPWGTLFLILAEFLIFTLFFSCSTPDVSVDKTYENGVEVVLNHLQPYEMENESSTFTLERIFSIDTEKANIAELDLGDIAFFDIDTEGNIYCIGRRTGENIIFKFNDKGEFQLSFGRKGQGPGEIQAAFYIHVTQSDEIVITNAGNNRMSVFFGDGTLKEEIKTGSGINAVCPLPNGNILLYKNFVDPTQDYITQNPLILHNSSFEELQELDRQMVPNPIVGERLKGFWHIFSWSVADEMIFTGFQERGYEIYVYDFNGRMLRKIKKEHKSVPVPQAHKDEFMGAFSIPIFDDIRNKIYFPASMPPFLSFLADERGWLYVLTYEQGENPGESIFDIFTPEGIFVGRKGLRVMSDESGLYAKIRNNRFYNLVEKESGYKELIVYQMFWE